MRLVSEGEHAEDAELPPMNELGHVEAAEVPQSEVPSDPYLVDEGYNELLSDVDPETRGHE